MLEVINKINVFIQDLLNNMCILENLVFVMHHLCGFLRIMVERLIELYQSVVISKPVVQACSHVGSVCYIFF